MRGGEKYSRSAKVRIAMHESNLLPLIRLVHLKYCSTYYLFSLQLRVRCANDRIGQASHHVSVYLNTEYLSETRVKVGPLSLDQPRSWVGKSESCHASAKNTDDKSSRPLKHSLLLLYTGVFNTEGFDVW